MKEKKIILRIYDELPTELAGILMANLPESGLNVYDTAYGEVIVEKMEDRKNDTYLIYKGK